MPFQTVHHTLKQSMTRNPHTDKHITGFYHIPCTNWHIRINQQIEIISTSPDKEAFNVQKLLAVILFRKDAINIRINVVDKIQ